MGDGAHVVAVAVRLQPRSSRPGAAGVKEGALQLRVASPPVEGRANEEARRLLAGILGVSKSSVSLKSGQKSRRKIFLVSGVTPSKLSSIMAEMAKKS